MDNGNGSEVGLVIRQSASVAVGEIPFGQLAVVGKVAAMRVLRGEKAEAVAAIQKLADRLEKSKTRVNVLLESKNLQTLKLAGSTERVGKKMARVLAFLKKEGAKNVTLTVDGHIEKGQVRGDISIQAGESSYRSTCIELAYRAELSVELTDLGKLIERDTTMIEKASAWLTDIRQKMADLPDMRDEAEAQLFKQASVGTKLEGQLDSVEASVRKSVLEAVSANRLSANDLG